MVRPPASLQCLSGLPAAVIMPIGKMTRSSPSDVESFHIADAPRTVNAYNTVIARLKMRINVAPAGSGVKQRRVVVSVLLPILVKYFDRCLLVGIQFIPRSRHVGHKSVAILLKAAQYQPSS